MGTSASSRGPGAGVPLVPEWVAPVPNQPASPQQGATPSPVIPPVAPPRRFQATRLKLGQFGRGGSQDDLKRGLGHYSRTGLGGAAVGTARMAATARTAGGLYGVLDSLRSGTPLPAGVALDPAQFAGKSQREVADLITQALRPVDGSQDSDAARDAVSRALSELLEQDPDANLTDLDPAQIDQIVESYIAHDLAHRIELDVGKAVLDKAPNYAEGVERLEEMKAYVRQEIARAFRARESIGQKLSQQNAAALSSAVLRDTFEIFESYL